MAPNDDTPRWGVYGIVPLAPVPALPETERLIQERAEWWQQRLAQRSRRGAGASRPRRSKADGAPGPTPPSWPPAAA